MLKNKIESKDQTVTIINETKTASTTPSSDISAPSTAAVNNTVTSTIASKINSIHESIKLSNNTNHNNNYRQHHHSYNNHYQQQYQYQACHNGYQIDQQQQFYLNEYAENNVPFYKYSDSINGLHRKESKTR